jgi:hypothetical protein
MKIIIFFALFLFIFSCERDTETNKEEIPAWLSARINHDEQEIEANPQSGLDIAAWVSYKFNNEYYYEYINLLSSMGPITYNYEGDTINYFEEPYTDYLTKRCCKKYIWRGPSYFEK